MYLEEKEFSDIIKKTPLVSIDLIIKDENSDVLLGWRINRPAKDTWFVPGGRIHKDETIVDAFLRITKKELGREIDIEEAVFLGVFEHFYNSNYADVPGFGTHYVVLGYEVSISTNKLVLPNEQHTKYCWLSENQILQNQDVHENTKAYFRKKHIQIKSKDFKPEYLLNYYNTLQVAISQYTNIIWAFPAAFLVLNFVAWDGLKEPPQLRFIISPLNALFIQAFFKLVANQRAIVNKLRETEESISEMFKDSLNKSLVPNFKYNWFTKLKSADLFKWGLLIFSISQFLYLCNSDLS